MKEETPHGFHIATRSTEETRKLGQKLGEIIPAGTVLALNGELGCGKTVFVQGLARGLEIPKEYYITSPTYTLIHEYPGRLPLFHVDLYRIEGPMEIEDTGFDDIFQGHGIVAIEWAERAGEDLPTDRITIRFEIAGPESRDIALSAYGQKEKNLLKKVVHDLYNPEANGNASSAG